MVQSPIHVSSGVEGAHLVLYDGVCGLCDWLVQFLLEHDRRAIFRFASLQSAIGKAIVERLGANPDVLSSFYVVTNYKANHAQILSRSRAVLFVVGDLGWPWKAASVMGILPTAVLDWAYDAIARVRYRLFGRLEHCLIPQPEFRRRFIDAEELR